MNKTKPKTSLTNEEDVAALLLAIIATVVETSQEHPEGCPIRSLYGAIYVVTGCSFGTFLEMMKTPIEKKILAQEGEYYKPGEAMTPQMIETILRVSPNVKEVF